MRRSTVTAMALMAGCFGLAGCETDGNGGWFSRDRDRDRDADRRTTRTYDGSQTYDQGRAADGTYTSGQRMDGTYDNRGYANDNRGYANDNRGYADNRGYSSDATTYDNSHSWANIPNYTGQYTNTPGDTSWRAGSGTNMNDSYNRGVNNTNTGMRSGAGTNQYPVQNSGQYSGQQNTNSNWNTSNQGGAGMSGDRNQTGSTMGGASWSGGRNQSGTPSTGASNTTGGISSSGNTSTSGGNMYTTGSSATGSSSNQGMSSSNSNQYSTGSSSGSMNSSTVMDNNRNLGRTDTNTPRDPSAVTWTEPSPNLGTASSDQRNKIGGYETTVNKYTERNAAWDGQGGTFNRINDADLPANVRAGFNRDVDRNTTYSNYSRMTRDNQSIYTSESTMNGYTYITAVDGNGVLLWKKRSDLPDMGWYGSQFKASTPNTPNSSTPANTNSGSNTGTSGNR